MALSWSFRRKALYSGVSIIVVIVALLLVYQIFFTHTPTCYDGIQNGEELGVDCGGTCSLQCSESTRAPLLLWARSFQTGPTTYTAAAYVQNLNAGSGAKAVAYRFKLLDSKNLLIKEVDGVADLPPIPTVPIMEANVDVGNRTVAHTLFDFTGEAIWNKVPTEKIPPITVSDQNLAEDGSRFSATLNNDSIQDASPVVATAVLFDQDGVARAASRSVVGRISRKSSQQVVFTWPEGVPGVVKAEITVLPPF